MKTLNKKKVMWITAFTIIILLFALSIISFVLTPFTPDLKVFIGAAKQAKYNSTNEFLGVIKTWELKGFASRLFIWMIYKCTILFVNFESANFSIVFSFIYVVVICMILGYSVWLIKERVKDKWLTVILFFLAATSVFFTYCCNHMQHEMTGGIILLLATALYLHKDKWKWKFISGMVFGSVFYFKSALLVMGLSFLAAILLLDKVTSLRKKAIDVFYYLVGAGVCVFGGLLVLYLVYPQEIYDMLDASTFQSTLLTIGISGSQLITIVKNIYGGLWRTCLRMPCVLMGILSSIYLLYNYVRNRKWGNTVLVCLLWSSPVIFIALSNCYFDYHFCTFLFPALISLLFVVKIYWLEGNRENMEQIIISALLIGIVLELLAKLPLLSPIFNTEVYYKFYITGMWLIGLIVFICNKTKVKKIFIAMIGGFIIFSCLYFTSFFSGYVVYLRSLHAEIEKIKISNEAYLKEAEVMYLDGGSSSYYIGAKSYLRYYYALPLQRIHQDSENAKNKCYVETYNKMMSYTGTYIFCDENWFFDRNEYEEVKSKLANEYVKINEVPYISMDGRLFGYKERCEIDYLSVYKRK